MRTATLTEPQARIVMDLLDFGVKNGALSTGGLRAASEVLAIAQSIEQQLTASDESLLNSKKATS